MSNKKQEKPLYTVPPGVCPVCLGDGGTLIANYIDRTDDRDVEEDLHFDPCWACDGTGETERFTNKDKKETK